MKTTKKTTLKKTTKRKTTKMKTTSTTRPTKPSTTATTSTNTTPDTTKALLTTETTTTKPTKPTASTSALNNSDVCTLGEIFENADLKGGLNAGNFLDRGLVNGVNPCMALCCLHRTCDLAYIISARCYLVECYTVELCSVVSKSKSSLTPTIGMVTRPNGPKIPTMRDVSTTATPKTTVGGKPRKPESLVDLSELKLELSQQPTTSNTLPRQDTPTKKHQCIFGPTLSHTAFVGGLNAGNFSNQGAVVNMETCQELCCKKNKCDVAVLMKRTCFLVTCHNEELCKTRKAHLETFSLLLSFRDIKAEIEAETLSRLTTTKKPTTTTQTTTQKTTNQTTHISILQTTKQPTTKIVTTVSVDSNSVFSINKSAENSSDVTVVPSDMSENSHFKSWCTTNFILEGVALAGGLQAGISEYVGKVDTMSECMQRCCQSKMCTVASLEKGSCYLLKCYDKELCKAKIKGPEHVLGYTMRDGWSLFSSAQEAMHDVHLLSSTVIPGTLPSPLTKINQSHSLDKSDGSTDQTKIATTTSPGYCHKLETLDSVRLRGGMKAGIFSEHGAVSSLDTCVEYCCRDLTCNLAYMVQQTCYTVNCFNRELCKTFDVPKFFLNPVIAFVSRNQDNGTTSNQITTTTVKPTEIQNSTKTVTTTTTTPTKTTKPTTTPTHKTTRHRTKPTKLHLTTEKPIVENINTHVSETGNDGEIMLKHHPHQNEDKLHDDNRFNKHKHLHSNQDIDLAHKRLHASKNHPTHKMIHLGTTVREFLRGELQMQPKGSSYIKALIHQLLEDENKETDTEESGSGSGESLDSKAYHKSRVAHFEESTIQKLHLNHHNRHKHHSKIVHVRKHHKETTHTHKHHEPTHFVMSQVDVDTIRALSPDTGHEGCSAHHYGCDHMCIHLWHGGHRCMCRRGYKLGLDGRHCLEQDMCDAKKHHCDQICVSDDGSPRCQCRLGYIMNRQTNKCEDMDECIMGIHGCEQECVNTQGSYVCQCSTGYQLSENRLNCLKINRLGEISKKDEILHRGPMFAIPAMVVDTVNYAEVTQGHNVLLQCTSRGYPTPKTSWLNYRNHFFPLFGSKYDILPGGSLLIKGAMMNDTGRYVCVSSNIAGTDTAEIDLQVQDANECQDGSSRCEQICENTIGSFICKCNNGYLLHANKKACRDVNECELQTHNCTQHCNNTIGSYFCSCHSGYQLSVEDKRTCKKHFSNVTLTAYHDKRFSRTKQTALISVIVVMIVLISAALLQLIRNYKKRWKGDDILDGDLPNIYSKSRSIYSWND